MHPTTYLTQVRDLVAKGELPAAIGRLQKVLAHSPQLTKVLAEKARYQVMVQQLVQGEMGAALATQTKDAIRAELIAILDEMEARQQEPAIRQEVAGAVARVVAADHRAAAYRLLRLAGLLVLVLLLLLGTFLYLLRDRIWPQTFVQTVLVHGPDGVDDRILRRQGEVMLDIGGARFTEAINEYGEAVFQELPSLYLGDTVRVSVAHEQPYRAMRRDTGYVLRAGTPIYLAVELNHLDSVFGQVSDFATEQPLEGVRVSYRRIATYSDRHGAFVLHIPPGARAKFIELDFQKPGYQPQHLHEVAPHLQRELRLSMHPLSPISPKP